MAINECKLNDIKIYRGTYDEIKALPTKNMALYLAWDRHMLLVGNNTGKKVPYGSIPELVRIEIDTRIRELTTNGEFDNWVNNTILYNLEERIEKAFNEELGEEIEEIHATASIVRELNELIKSVDNHVDKVEENLNNVSEHLKDDFYTKVDIDKYNTEFTGKLDEDLSDIRTQVGAANRGVVETKEIIDELKEGLGNVNINITNVYTKTQVDKIVDDTKEELEGIVEENSIQHMKSSEIEPPVSTYGLRRTAVEEEKGKLILVTDSESEDFAFGDLLYQTSNGIYHVGEQHLYKNLLDYVPREELDKVILGYYTKSEVDELIEKISLGDVSDLLKDFVKKGEVYTRSEIDELIKNFNSDDVQELLKDYLTIDAATNEYYSKAAIDKLLAEFKPSVEVDLGNYYTKEEVDVKLDKIIVPEGTTIDLFNYYTKSEVDGKIPDVSKYITADDLPEVPTKVSDLENDSKFITIESVPDITGLASESYVDIKVAELVNSAPESLNTLKELADAIQQNESIVETLNQSIGTKANISDVYSKTEVDAKIEGIKIPEGTTVDLSNYYTKSEVDGKIPDVSKFITADDIPVVEVPTKLSELENDKNFITLAEVPVVEVPTKLSELENDKGFITSADIPAVDLSGYAKKEEIPTKLSELENDTLFINQYDMVALTGDEMNALLKNPNELNKYSLVFCKKNSTGGLTFKRGVLYYVDNEGFEVMSGGSSAPIEKEVVKSIFTVTENGGVNNFEIENTTKELIFTIKADNVNAIDNAKFNGENLDLSQLVNGVTVKKTLNLNEAKTTSFKLTYTTKTDTSLIDYQVSANNTSFSYNVVAPTFYGIGEDIRKHTKVLNNSSFTITPTETGVMYIYSPVMVKGMANGIFPSDYNVLGEVNLTVNGVENLKYYKYSFEVASIAGVSVTVTR